MTDKPMATYSGTGDAARPKFALNQPLRNSLNYLKQKYTRYSPYKKNISFLKQKTVSLKEKPRDRAIEGSYMKVNEESDITNLTTNCVPRHILPKERKEISGSKNSRPSSFDKKVLKIDECTAPLSCDLKVLTVNDSVHILNNEVPWLQNRFICENKFFSVPFCKYQYECFQLNCSSDCFEFNSKRIATKNTKVAVKKYAACLNLCEKHLQNTSPLDSKSFPVKPIYYDKTVDDLPNYSDLTEIEVSLLQRVLCGCKGLSWDEYDKMFLIENREDADLSNVGIIDGEDSLEEAMLFENSLFYYHKKCHTKDFASVLVNEENNIVTENNGPGVKDTDGTGSKEQNRIDPLTVNSIDCVEMLDHADNVTYVTIEGNEIGALSPEIEVLDPPEKETIMYISKSEIDSLKQRLDQFSVTYMDPPLLEEATAEENRTTGTVGDSRTCVQLTKPGTILSAEQLNASQRENFIAKTNGCRDSPFYSNCETSKDEDKIKGTLSVSVVGYLGDMNMPVCDSNNSTSCASAQNCDNENPFGLSIASVMSLSASSSEDIHDVEEIVHTSIASSSLKNNTLTNIVASSEYNMNEPTCSSVASANINQVSKSFGSLQSAKHDLESVQSIMQNLLTLKPMVQNVQQQGLQQEDANVQRVCTLPNTKHLISNRITASAEQLPSNIQNVDSADEPIHLSISVVQPQPATGKPVYNSTDSTSESAFIRTQHSCSKTIPNPSTELLNSDLHLVSSLSHPLENSSHSTAVSSPCCESLRDFTETPSVSQSLKDSGCGPIITSSGAHPRLLVTSMPTPAFSSRPSTNNSGTGTVRFFRVNKRKQRFEAAIVSLGDTVNERTNDTSERTSNYQTITTATPIVSVVQCINSHAGSRSVCSVVNPSFDNNNSTTGSGGESICDFYNTQSPDITKKTEIQPKVNDNHLQSDSDSILFSSVLRNCQNDKNSNEDGCTTGTSNIAMEVIQPNIPLIQIFSDALSDCDRFSDSTTFQKSDIKSTIANDIPMPVLSPNSSVPVLHLSDDETCASAPLVSSMLNAAEPLGAHTLDVSNAKILTAEELQTLFVNKPINIISDSSLENTTFLSLPFSLCSESNTFTHDMESASSLSFEKSIPVSVVSAEIQGNCTSGPN